MDATNVSFTLLAQFELDPRQPDANYMVPWGTPGKSWKLISDDEFPLGSFVPKLVEFPATQGILTRGYDLRTWAEKQQRLLGHRHAEALLREQERIPKEWRQHDLLFLGTYWAERGETEITRLTFSEKEGKWKMYQDWAGDYFRGRAVALEQSSV